MAGPTLPAGFTVGHGTDLERVTGCTVVLAPEEGAEAAVEVRGGGPGTRETDILSPAAPTRPISAVVFSGGSANGLHIADVVARRLREQGRGYLTRLGQRIPLVPAAVVADTMLGDDGPPGVDLGVAALEDASADPARGTVGAGTGCSIGKFLGPPHTTKGGVGLASDEIRGAAVSALAVVNAIGDVLAEDGSVLAGPYKDGRYHRTVDILRAGLPPLPPVAGEATTLVCVMTDARLDRLGAWQLARAATTGCARAVDPTATQFDGDACFVLAAGDAEPDPLALQGLVPHVVAAAIRDAVRQATSLAGSEAAGSR